MNNPNWCAGKCGEREVCSDRTYREGYCLEPRAREFCVKLKPITDYTKKPISKE